MSEKKTARPADPAGQDSADVGAGLWRRSLVESAGPARSTLLDGRGGHAQDPGADPTDGGPRSQGPGLLWPAGAAGAAASGPDVAALCRGASRECRHDRFPGVVLRTSRGARLGRSSGVSRACASSSVHCRAKVRGSTRLNRNGSMASGPCRKRIDCSALLNSKRGSMPTIAVSVKSISSCQKRSLDYALGIEQLR
jgi:hypothetical protein